MEDIFGFMPTTRDEHEELKKIVKDLIEVNKKQAEYAQGLQKQIDLLKDGFNLLRKLNNV